MKKYMLLIPVLLALLIPFANVGATSAYDDVIHETSNSETIPFYDSNYSYPQKTLTWDIFKQEATAKLSQQFSDNIKNAFTNGQFFAIRTQIPNGETYLYGFFSTSISNGICSNTGYDNTLSFGIINGSDHALLLNSGNAGCYGYFQMYLYNGQYYFFNPTDSYAGGAHGNRTYFGGNQAMIDRWASGNQTVVYNTFPIVYPNGYEGLNITNLTPTPPAPPAYPLTNWKLEYKFVGHDLTLIANWLNDPTTEQYAGINSITLTTPSTTITKDSVDLTGTNIGSIVGTPTVKYQECTTELQAIWNCSGHTGHAVSLHTWTQQITVPDSDIVDNNFAINYAFTVSMPQYWSNINRNFTIPYAGGSASGFLNESNGSTGSPTISCGSLDLFCNLQSWFNSIFKNNGADYSASFVNWQTNTHGLIGIVSAPVSMISNLANDQCQDLHMPLPYGMQDLVLPCMTGIYNTYGGTLFTIYQTVIDAVLTYFVFINIFAITKGFKDPHNDSVEVLKL